MYIDIERLTQLLIALLMGSAYYYLLIPRLKSIGVLIVLLIMWLAGFILARDGLVQLVLAFNNGVYPFSTESSIILTQDIFLALLIFSIGKLKSVNDAS